MTDATSPLRFVNPNDVDVDRRTFMKLLSATVLAAGAAACAEPTGEIVPYVSQPPEVVPGVPLHFATAMELDGYATGLLVESREGRPVKVEGNPAHPASLGAAGVFHQASVLQLYDPDRARYFTHDGHASAWIEYAAAFSPIELRRISGRDGSGLRFLLEPTASPMLMELAARVRERLPAAQFHFYAPLATTHAIDGARIAFGQPAQPIFTLDHADVVMTADANLFAEGPLHLRYARHFADGRRVRRSSDAMNRLYTMEGLFSPTGMWANHRLTVRPSDVTGLLAALLREALASGAPTPSPFEEVRPRLDHLASTAHADWIRVVARDLLAHRGRSVVAVGDRQPAIAHALGCALNHALGATDHTVSYFDPVLPPIDAAHSLAALTEAIRAGQVAALVILGGNPSYQAPADADFPRLLRSVPLTLYSGLHENETARDAHWFVPGTHYLESWGDARTVDGTTSIVQPLIAPLYGGRSLVDLLAFFAGDDRTPHEIVHSFWQTPDRLGSNAETWRESLRRGVVPDTAARTLAVTPSSEFMAALDREPPAVAGSLEMAFVSDPSVHDGRFANNAWLQELPDPVTKMTWDNAALMSAATARQIGVDESQVVELEARSRRLRAPAFVVPGMADGLVVLPFGYGRTGAETIARGIGVNAFAFWTSGGYVEAGVTARPAVALGMRLSHEFAVTAAHWSIEGRSVVLDADLDRFQRDPHFTAAQRGATTTLYHSDDHEHRTQQWAMAIDLTVCTGCSACVVACQAENNTPVVGKVGVQERREMHWLRIDRYIAGTAAHPRVNLQPMLCQHCEDAPCEYVCPVNATVHSPDGLNEMVYNRCVGTRFCSNNCPYKVRRFNWYNYTADTPAAEQMAMNPDVTVRARGVMEKCSFCVQRIRRADIDAGIAGSQDPYTRLQTACQQACPTRAIVFGSIADPGAKVTRDMHADQSYSVLHDLGTRPRVVYLARLRNRNPALPEETT